MNESPVSSMDDEIDLLDLLVTVAESWKLLVFVPLLVGVLTAVGTTFFQQTYKSDAILRLMEPIKDKDGNVVSQAFTEQHLAVLHSSVVLDPLLEPFGYLSRANGVVDTARDALKQDMTTSVNKTTRLVTVSVQSTSPEIAQKINSQALNLLFDELTPKGHMKAGILQSIEHRRQAVVLAEKSIELLVNPSVKGSITATSSDQSGVNTSALVRIVLENKQVIQELEQSLLSKASEVIIQTPTLPQKPMPRKRAITTMIAILASGFALLLFVFVRKALQNAGTNPESAAKIQRIKQSFGASSKTT